jgi:proteasome lid subunit RPN8/RPN11
MQPTVPPSAVDRIYLPKSIRDAMMVHLLEAAPNEGVGLLAVDAVYTDEDEALAMDAVRFFPGTNIESSPSRFTMEPAEVVAAFGEMRAADLQFGAIVHSHLRGPATPSATDLREAYYPDVLLIIASFAGQPAVLRAWRIVLEEELQVVQPVEIIVLDGA